MRSLGAFLITRIKRLYLFLLSRLRPSALYIAVRARLEKQNRHTLLNMMDAYLRKLGSGERSTASAVEKSSLSFSPILPNSMPKTMIVTKIGFGSYTDARGIVTFSPNNILLNSNIFSNPSWVGVDCGVELTSISSPVSGENAWKLFESINEGPHYIYGKSLGAFNSHILVSIFAKSLERSSFVLEISNFKTGSAGCRFNLSREEIETASSTTEDYRDLSATLTKYPDGWFRCALRVRKAKETVENYLTISLSLNDGNIYKGDGKSGLLISCGQLELVTYQREPSQYFNTRNHPAFGLRFDHDAVSRRLRGLAIEQASENLLYFGESFQEGETNSFGWIHRHIVRLATDKLSPSGERVAVCFSAERANASILYAKIFYEARPRTLSCWLRAAGGPDLLEYTANGGAQWNSFKINKYWRRYIWQLSPDNHHIGFRLPSPSQKVEMWGAQLEEGECATSYISTERGIRTRSEDGLLVIDSQHQKIELSVFDYVTQGSDSYICENGKELSRKNIAINGWRGDKGK